MCFCLSWDLKEAKQMLTTISLVSLMALGHASYFDVLHKLRALEEQ